ncbi:hypothetical protein [Rummeliibacillus pycnus]|uniref:hypothetical protein n=1 Tax=Rummeliibacillus pycnus TaxID=101070 RepID=UPI003D2D87C7
MTIEITEQNNDVVERVEKQTLVVGLIMPISNAEGFPIGHWEEVRKIIEESLNEIKEYHIEASMVSESEDTAIIQKNIIQRIYKDDIVIVDVSSKNPNVMFELGLRLAFDKPFILLKDDLTDYVFDISSIYHINYRRDLRYKDIVDVKNEIKRKIVATYKKSLEEDSMYLKDYGTFKVAELENTELPIKDYMEKMFSDIRTEIKGIRKDNNNSALSNNMQKIEKNKKYHLENRILNLVSEYLLENPSLDTTEFYNKNHEIQHLIRDDKEVGMFATSIKEVENITIEVFSKLDILPF